MITRCVSWRADEKGSDNDNNDNNDNNDDNNDNDNNDNNDKVTTDDTNGTVQVAVCVAGDMSS